jgi:hypothetical protein
LGAPSGGLAVCLALLSLAVGACGGGSHRGQATRHPGQVVAVSASTPGPGKCPLTDQDPPQGISLDRPVLAVKVDGSLAAERPSGQSGLDAADIVYEEPVEGGLGWFLALFHCGEPTTVGPVREARLEDPDLLAQYGSALYATAGGPAAIMDKVTATAGLINLDSVRHGPAYSRNDLRTAPYNLFADPAKLRAARLRSTVKPPGPPSSQFQFIDTAGQSPAENPSPKPQSLTFKFGAQITYKYDPTAASYLRFENGQAHRADSGSQIRVVNVVVMWVKISQTKIVDPAGNASPYPIVVGQGNAMVLNGGVEHDGTWTRGDLSAPISFVDHAGKPIPMMAGNTWIHLIASEEPVYVQ